jgi:hypothetical protein
VKFSDDAPLPVLKALGVQICEILFRLQRYLIVENDVIGVKEELTHHLVRSAKAQVTTGGRDAKFTGSARDRSTAGGTKLH